MLEGKKCTKCGEVKPLGAFVLRRKGHSARRSRCRDCLREIDRARRPPPKGPQYKDTKTHRECSKCGQMRPRDKFRKQAGGRHGLKRTCKDCDNAINYAYRQSGEGLAKKQAYQRKYNRKRKQDADAIRRVMSDSPPDLKNDKERLAYIRGFFKGRAVRDGEANAVEECRDLVFRIAHEVYRPNESCTYEDIVCYAYDGLLAAIRSYTPTRQKKASLRSFAASKIRFHIIDKLRERGATNNVGSRKNPRWMRTSVVADRDGEECNAAELKSVSRESPALEGEAHLDSEQFFFRVAQEFGSKHAYVVRRMYDGATLNDIANELRVTESRVCQMRSKVREWVKQAA